MADIIPYTPPAHDILLKLSVSIEQLTSVPWSEIAQTTMYDPETGHDLSAYVLLRQMSTMLDYIAEAALSYEEMRAKK